ncbi:MAG: hypothetical protein FWH40_07725 [Coriobacteriia bacterium]|nr:hypothetical protein [Coriobacteriia bacterium]
MSSFQEDLGASWVLFCCEGTAEKVIIRKLSTAGYLFCPDSSIIEITATRGARDIERSFLDIDYDKELMIVRILDSRSEAFKLGKLYEPRFKVYDVLTHREIEILVIINEGCLADYEKVKSTMKPSTYCKEVLGMKKVKQMRFLDDYWDLVSLKKAILEYKRITQLRPGELCLADLLV